MTISEKLLDELLKDYNNPEDLLALHCLTLYPGNTIPLCQ